MTIPACSACDTTTPPRSQSKDPTTPPSPTPTGPCRSQIQRPGSRSRQQRPPPQCALATETPRREGWEHARTAVMTRLLNAKYHQHPELAEILLATGDATVIYDDMNSAFWGDNAGRGRNWSGRILELVRSELQAQRAGIFRM
ncbi:NADAR domain-containing protein [Streptomyces sp. NPDC087856]|uniref:NADAR domain-containing protein n=1 Tax=Streptomyces sp. NPDC087856 TaxID=3365811 RepID=UPI003817DC12